MFSFEGVRLSSISITELPLENNSTMFLQYNDLGLHTLHDPAAGRDASAQFRPAAAKFFEGITIRVITLSTMAFLLSCYTLVR
jgi:hypothetical protein